MYFCFNIQICTLCPVCILLPIPHYIKFLGSMLPQYMALSVRLLVLLVSPKKIYVSVCWATLWVCPTLMCDFH